MNIEIQKPDANESVTPVTDVSASVAPRASVVWLFRMRDYGVVILMLVIFIALIIATPTFLTVTNLTNVMDAAVIVGLIAVSGGFLIIAGGFDLSAGAIFVTGAVVCAKMVNAYGPVIGIVSALIVGALLGLVNGLLCTVGGLNAFVGTLGTAIAFEGLATAISGSRSIRIEDPNFSMWADTDILGVSSSTWIFIGVSIFFGVLLNFTIFGRHARATGGNLAAARLSGVPVNRVITIAFVLSGLCAALAGTIVASRSGIVSSSTGATIVFEALAAILIGGNSIFGGVGAIWRTLVGVAILTLLSNGFNLLGIDPMYQKATTGVLIVLAIGADAWTRKKG